MTDPRLKVLWQRWLAFQEQGVEVTLEALCADCPELLQQFREILRRIDAAEAFLAPPRSGEVELSDPAKASGGSENAAIERATIDPQAAAIATRRILVEQARAKLAWRRNGVLHRTEPADIAEMSRCEEVLALDKALGRLASQKPDHARLVELRYFGGLSADEAAAALGVSPSTSDRMWRFSRAWLAAEIQDGNKPWSGPKSP